MTPQSPRKQSVVSIGDQRTDTGEAAAAAAGPLVEPAVRKRTSAGITSGGPQAGAWSRGGGGRRSRRGRASERGVGTPVCSLVGDSDSLA